MARRSATLVAASLFSLLALVIGGCGTRQDSGAKREGTVESAPGNGATPNLPDAGDPDPTRRPDRPVLSADPEKAPLESERPVQEAGSLVGLWRGLDSNDSLDFSPEGRVAMAQGGRVLVGSWILPDEMPLRLAMRTGKGKVQDRAYLHEISGDNLVLLDEGGWRGRFTRASPVERPVDARLFGSWEADNGRETVEFTPWGTLISETPNGGLAGTWSAAAGRLEMNLAAHGRNSRMVAGYRFEDGELRLDRGGSISTYRR